MTPAPGPSYLRQNSCQERVQFSLCEYKEHREMGLVSYTISIEVGSDTHLLAIVIGGQSEPS